MLESLKQLRDAGIASRLDIAFGAWIAARSNEACGLAAALSSAEVDKGHICLDLEAATCVLKAQGIVVPDDWHKTLEQSNVVAKPGERAPLVLDGGQLYLHRYWTYETRIANTLKQLATPTAGTDPATLNKALRKLFAHVGNGELDHQALAAAIGATRRLAILSGGPGTGKTWTISRLIALARALDPALKMVLTAPTGKAASRLGEVVGNNAEQSTDKPTTLHRLLGYNPATQRIRHDADNPLDADLIVVDEASMVDIGLMARLLAALKPKARLVLVGDRNQLASVEAGAVFGDICLAAGGFPADEAAPLEVVLGAALPRGEEESSPVSASIALLKRNYRFGAKAIGELAQAVVTGDADTAFNLLQSTATSLSPSPSPLSTEATSSSPFPLWGEGRGEGSGAETGKNVLIWQQLATERHLAHELERIANTHFKPIRNANSPEAALHQLNHFRLLAAERRGPFGVEELNTRIESLLGIRRQDTWYQGRPILITENDYELELFNGDFGILWPDESNRAMLHVRGEADQLRTISPARLPAHETCYALTVHKAQGSEFDRIALLLPPRESRVVTRELLYTGITRAREGVEVWSTEAALRTAIATPIRRASGLAARLAV